MKSLMFGLVFFLSTSAFAADFTIEMNGKRPGEVFASASPTCPDHSLLANGIDVSRATYPALFASIGTAHGIGNGSTTFGLPDYRGRFLRGTDGGVGRDADRASRLAVNGGNAGDNVGSVQGDVFSSHTHVQNAHSHEQSTAHPSTQGGGQYPYGMGGVAFSYPNSGFYTVAATATNQNTGGSETRPKNINVTYCIQF